MTALAQLSGLAPVVQVRDAWMSERLRHDLKTWSPKSDLGRAIRDLVGLHMLQRDQLGDVLERLTKIVVLSSKLSIVVIRGPNALHGLPGSIEDYGVVGDRVVTTAGVGFIVDAFQNSVELENMKYHALGTGSTAEDNGDTALVTELTTEYTGNVRATGTTAEGASANIYQTVATNTLDGTPGAALREHGVFSASSAGVLLDRTVFASVTLSSGDGLQSTYELTCSAGG